MSNEIIEPDECAAIRTILRTEHGEVADGDLRQRLLAKGFVREDAAALVVTFDGHSRYLAKLPSQFSDLD